MKLQIYAHKIYIYIRWQHSHQLQEYGSVSYPLILITRVMFISALLWPDYMVETCSTSYVYIKQVRHIPTSVVFTEDIPTLLCRRFVT
jgi:hypothetical protein